jgi:hypothetical protein
MYVFVYICMYLYMYVCICVCMYVCMYVFVYVCMYVCMYVAMYVCIYVNISSSLVSKLKGVKTLYTFPNFQITLKFPVVSFAYFTNVAVSKTSTFNERTVNSIEHCCCLLCSRSSTSVPI